MDVSELITSLQELPPDMPVVTVYDDIEYGDTFSGRIKVSLETLKLTEDMYHRTGPYVRMKDGKQVELPFTREEVVLLTVG
jgi:hypothetical protein